MQNNNGKYLKKKARLPLSVYLCYVLALTLVLSGVTMSKYTSSASGTASASVAKFGMEVTGVGNIECDFNTWTNPNDTPSISASDSFTVKNTSEVSVEYTINVKFDSAVPSNITLSMVTGSASKAPAINTATNTYSFGTYTLGAGGTANHALNATAGLGNSTDDQSLGFSVSVNAEQVD